ncbi:putative Hybrid PKS-NRPS biosynthetic cluster [Microsporum canis]
MSEPVGIIGSACRFPGGADSPSKLWELLKDPKDVLREFPLDRLNLWSFYHRNGEYHGSTDVQNKSYLLSQDIRLFDAPFFRISPSEADCMDPQQRMLLETVYEALESAGCTLDQIQGSLTSVYVGLMNGDYADIQTRDIETIATHHGTGTHRSIISNRISYFLDLKGASMTIDTACSSSLVALHQAVQSLRLGESDIAIVAGANLILDPTMYVAESKLHMLSPDSRSRMWDSAANGYARGEGFAAVVLKLLDKAIDDGDHVECVVRGSAVNSDGRTAGITVPSATAQTILIRQAYRDAGLDPLIDRCQYFEAHGTGTPAGDPVEARAIRDAFFPEGSEDSVLPGNLLVGSIKTIVGHLEGCAGLAGVLKASLAMQNRTILPNMLFSELNPAITPFYDRLEVPTKISEWPEVPVGSPLRVSVNSFGFGGTNAHVILESFDCGEVAQTRQDDDKDATTERFVGPLIISANSRDSLLRSVKEYADYIRNNVQLDLADIAWTLQFRRTQFSNKRASFSGATRQKLLSYMDVFVADNMVSTSSGTGAITSENPLSLLGNDTPGILGIFTGQGAQWPSMGRNLILHCPLFRESITRCEASLASLKVDQPMWSLMQELLAEGERSRVHESAISQPLCTAVQIGLVDLLHASGISLRGVVGHSSGEIAAVYAAGIISAKDAIRIAYYRGFHAKLAKGPKCERGAMLAAGLSFESATDFCAIPKYNGRVTVAALNSPSSITFSGDADAIGELKNELDSQKTFARKLNVATAYHSHHMAPCAEAYLNSLRGCNIQVHRPSEACIWVSSVYGNTHPLLDDQTDDCLAVLKDQYWVDNLLSPVLFAPALECSLYRAGPFDIVTEVGPHPALKGPSTQTLKASLGSSLPYFSIMRRGDDEVEAFSGGLGHLWEHFGAAALIDFDGHRQAFTRIDQLKSTKATTTTRLIKGLPSYCWDHNRKYWKESRISRNFRLDDRKIHEILGRRATDDTAELLRWRNILRLTELPWVRDHAFQGQAILPGAAYISAIIEAVKAFVSDKNIKLVDIFDFKIPKAVVLQENKSTELTTTLGPVVRKADSVWSAEFSFSATVADGLVAIPERTCYGRVEIHVGEADFHLPSPERPPPNLNALNIDVFYKALKELGIDYRSSFRAIKSAQRTVGYSSTLAAWDIADLGSSYSLHPAILDVGFQSVLAALASPQTGQMWTMYLPVGIRRATIRLGPLSHAGASTKDTEIKSRSSAQITSLSSNGVEGNLQIVFGSFVGVQAEGIELQATGDPLAGADRVLFSNTIWDSDISAGMDKVVLESPTDPATDDELLEALGRTSLYYYRVLLDEISPREMKSLAWHHQMFWQSAKHWVEEVRAGRHPSAKREWLDDTRDAVWKQAERYEHTVDIQITRSLGERLLSIARGETQPLEVMMEGDMLSRFYVESYGLDSMNDHIARAVAQITHRFPQANILEIGAGSGGTTRKILRAVGNTFRHYTFTDISSGFFEKGAAKFAPWQRKMTFKVCDIEKNPIDQGFDEEAYDIIVAANVLHATRCLSDTMRHVRQLLKPGGYLVMMEITGDLLRLGFIMGSLPGWWLGPQLRDEGRQWGPGISCVQWDDLLQRTGFSGVNHMATDNPDPHKQYVSTLISQAVDDEFALLLNPLAGFSPIPALPHKLLILGGETLHIAKVTQELKRTLNPLVATIETISRLEYINIGPEEELSIISLTELDYPLFASLMTATRLKNLQTLLKASSSALWVTAGCRNSSPTSNMFVGIARALRAERSDINLQLLDVGNPTDTSAKVLAEHFLRLVLVKKQEYADKRMLWTTESEIAQEGQTLLIPRLVPDKLRNERYNALRRVIIKEVTSADTEVEVEASGSMVSLLGVDSRLFRRLMTPSTLEQFSLHVHLSMALPHPGQHYFLCYGTVGSIVGQEAFVLSRVNRSVILCNSQDALLLDSASSGEKGDKQSILEALAAQLIARNLASILPRTGAVLVYEPPSEALAIAIESSSLWKGRQVYYATSRTDRSMPSSWISVDPYIFGRFIRQKFPDDITAVVDFSLSDSSSILAVDATKSVIRRFEPSLLKVNSQELTSAYCDALPTISHGKSVIETKAIPLNALSGNSSSILAYPAVIDWRRWQDKEPTIVQVKPLIATGIFTSSKTHLMVGLNGDLGQSICGYMVRNGARHIAIASRRGEVNPDWLESMRKDYRANVRVYKMDVTNQQSIRLALGLINTEMPPIGGVANGALILHDKMFMNMDAESLNKTLMPKVDGSIYLDEVFSNLDLDYFVLFSSVGTVGGNRGQGNYHAANMFMTSLVANRRLRGLAASVIHVGMILDVGYVARQDRKLFEHMRKQGFMPTSETDAHFLWVEGVLASPADSHLDADICMGFEFFEDRGDDSARPPWYHDSRLSHFITQPEEETSDARRAIGHSLHIRQRLDGARSVKEAHLLLQEAFSSKLEAMMQLDAGTVNIDVPLLDLGFDSLLAVETRTWFLKEVHVDVPVLRFLGGDTVREICLDASTDYLTSRASKNAENNKNKTATDTCGIIASEAGERPQLKFAISLSDSDQSLQNPSPSSISNQAIIMSTITDETEASDTYVTILTDRHGEISEKALENSGIQTCAHVQVQDPVRVETMSYAQTRLWFLGQYLDDPTTCNITVQYVIKGELDIDQLCKALEKVVSHHASLRTCFYTDAETGRPTQGLLRAPHPSSTLKYLQASSRKDIQLEFDKLANYRWDLHNGETFAATLFPSSKDEHILIFGYHHIVMDGVSWYTVLHDLDKAYTSKPLSQQSKSYMDASIEQRCAVESGAYDREIRFWEDMHAKLPDVIPLLPLSCARRRQPLQRYQSYTFTRDIGSDLVAKIKDACKTLGVTPFNLYLSALQVLLHKLLDIDDLCIGVTDASRNDHELAKTVGFFLNILPLRFKVHRQASFADLVRQTSQNILTARSNGHVPVDVILERLSVPRDPSFSPLFQVVFNYRIGAMAEATIGKCQMSVESIRDAESPFDLGFGIYESAGGSCGLQIITQSYLYDPDAAACLAHLYISILDIICLDTSQMLGQYDPFDMGARKGEASVRKGPRKAWEWPPSLSERVNDMIRIHRDSVAIVNAECPQSLTYGQLGSQIRSVASAIQKEDPTLHSRIAVLCQPSMELIISMLAIQQMGHVYVSLDTNLPNERHVAILTDCKPTVLLCHDKTLASIPLLNNKGFSIINLSALSTNYRLPLSFQADLYDPTLSAFLFYTSGSTGQPKGIYIPQSGILNHIAHKTDYLSLQRETVLQQSSFGFDMSLTQIFVALANGGTVVIAPKASRGDPIALSQLMLVHGVTITIATPSEYAMLLRYGQAQVQQCSSWKHACMGGETVTKQLVQAFAELGNMKLRLTNCYGPTEASLAVTFDNLSLTLASEMSEYASVGTVIPNNSVYIVDEFSSQAVPIGFPGEICIGGAGVAMGYLNLPHLSASKFVEDPFTDTADIQRGWSRMFRTGDRGRLRTDGSLVFMGRLGSDRMVKLRGLRIDLDDVANTMVRAAGDVIAEAVITIYGEYEEKILIAHVVPCPGRKGMELAKGGWREIVRRLPLPAYMRPSLVITVNHLPQTPNGKVDRGSLEAPDFQTLKQVCVENEETKKLSLEEGELRFIWEEVLGESLTSHRAELTSETDFFMVGGSSLLLMRLQGAIKETLGLVVPVIELYQASTLGRMAARIRVGKQHQEPTEEIDWETETEYDIPSSYIPTMPDRHTMQESNREILITGAHTFLGSEILQALINDNSVRRVHCIALPRAAGKRIVRSSKVSPYLGSLQAKSLGLSPDEISYLQPRIDLIIHAGSVGHCLNNYSSLRLPNVGSVRCLVELALPRRIPIHFISSNRVILLSGHQKLPPISVGQHQPPTDGSEGFTASKWAGERLLERVSQATGLDVTVHRPCAVVGPNAPSEDALNALLHFAEAQNSVPRFHNLAGYLDFAPVTDVARNISNFVLKCQYLDNGSFHSGICAMNIAPPTGDSSMTIVHYSSGIETPVLDFRGRMETLHGREFDELDFAEWMHEAIKRGMDSLISTYLESLIEQDRIISFPYLGEALGEGL